MNFTNTANNTIIAGTTKADNIYNTGRYVTIVGGKGNDFIDNGKYVAPTYFIGGINSSINGGAGNDTITNLAANITILGGTGNDSILNYSSSRNVLFKYSGGNDFISGFNATSTLQISSGKMNSVVTTNGEDYFLAVGNSTITLAGAAELEKVNIINSKGKERKLILRLRLPKLSEQTPTIIYPTT